MKYRKQILTNGYKNKKIFGMENNKPLIVTSHFSEDLNWLVNQNEYDYKIYTKNKPACLGYPADKVYECPNVGKEASSYLCYIIENYDNLPDYVAFIHGHEASYHQTDTIINLLKNIKYKGFETLNRKDYRNIFHDGNQDESPKMNWQVVNHFYDELGLNLPRPKKLEYTACAQFVVSKEIIRSNSINVYKNILSWLLKRTDIHMDWTSRVMEHLWCYILTHKETEESMRYHGGEEIEIIYRKSVGDDQFADIKILSTSEVKHVPFSEISDEK